MRRAPQGAPHNLSGLGTLLKSSELLVVAEGIETLGVQLRQDYLFLLSLRASDFMQLWD